MESQEIISLCNARCRKPEWQLAQPVTLSILKGEQLAVVGRNGAGKTLLADLITGRHPAFPDMVHYHFEEEDEPSRMVSDCIKTITFRDTYGTAADRTYYLQQRWNQTEMSDEDIPLVGEKLEEAFALSGDDTPERRERQRRLYELFSMAPLLDKRLVLLSSGELRKYRLCASLFTQPRLLVIDNPFIGLDAPTRLQLSALFSSIAEEGRTQLILVLSKSDEIPDFITHVVEVEDRVAKPKQTRSSYLALRRPLPGRVLSESSERSLKKLLASREDNSPVPPVVAAFRNVTIRYGERTILSDLTWTVGRGEHWALQGSNGSGKSTLLSLVCADNHQAYACDISLFGRRRGSGESIWDIKRRIGYVSPEMHRAYQHNISALQVVASGLKDTMGLYARPNADELAACRWWMDLFGLGSLAERPLLSLSTGQQRLLLVARAFVKCPDLLILDEPLHGLDDYNRQLVKDIIEAYCQHPDKTLIMVTHYAEELPPCIDHHITLKRQ